MRATLVVVVALASGCDLAFDLTRPPPGPSDRDVDGVFDDDDNCPDVFNPGQENGDADPTGDVCERCPGIDDAHHDEDDDDVDDACDNCPHLANLDQMNADMDDLGDACDAPGTRIDCVLMFDPFVTMPAALATRGMWALENDGLVQTDRTENGGLFSFPPEYETPRVVTRVRIEDFDPVPASNQHSAGTYVALTGFGTDPDAPAGVLTTVIYSPQAGEVELRTAHINSNSVSDIRANDTLAPNTRWTNGVLIDLTADMQSTTRLFASTAIDASTASFEATFTERPAGQVGFRSFRTHARFEFVLISQQRPVLPCR